MSKLLFIGGPADGERHEVEDSRISVCVAQKNRLYPDIQALDSLKLETLKLHTYIKMPFKGNSQLYHIMALDGMTADEMIAKLIFNYKRGTKK